MTNGKTDEMTRTGTHRAWGGESATPRGPAHANGEQRPADRNWLDRSNPPLNTRHGAITRSLYSWSNYKDWTEKVKSSWDKDKPGGNGGNNGSGGNGNGGNNGGTPTK